MHWDLLRHFHCAYSTEMWCEEHRLVVSIAFPGCVVVSRRGKASSLPEWNFFFASRQCHLYMNLSLLLPKHTPPCWLGEALNFPAQLKRMSVGERICETSVRRNS